MPPKALHLFIHRIKREVSFPLTVLDKALSDADGWLVGGRFTAADLNVASVCTWALMVFGLSTLSTNFPNLTEWLMNCLARENSPLHQSTKQIFATSFSRDGLGLRLERNGPLSISASTSRL